MLNVAEVELYKIVRHFNVNSGLRLPTLANYLAF